MTIDSSQRTTDLVPCTVPRSGPSRLPQRVPISAPGAMSLVINRARMAICVTLFCLFYIRGSVLLPFAERAPPALSPDEAGCPAAASDGPIDWSRVAYGQYATNSLYLCNSVLFFTMLHQLGSKADRVLLYPSGMLTDPDAVTADDENGRLLIKARDQLAVKLSPISVQRKITNDCTWRLHF